MINKDTASTDEELRVRYGYTDAQIQMVRADSWGEGRPDAESARKASGRVRATTQATRATRVAQESRKKKPRDAAKVPLNGTESKAIPPEGVRAILDKQKARATAVHPSIRRMFAGQRGGGDLAIVLSNLVLFWFTKDKNGKIRASASVKGDARKWVSMPIWRWAEIHGLAESTMRKVLNKLQAQRFVDIHTVRGQHGVWVTIRPEEIVAGITAAMSAAVEDA